MLNQHKATNLFPESRASSNLLRKVPTEIHQGAKASSGLESQSPPDNAKELVKRYKMGERNFENASLGSEHLNCEDLTNINLRGADLCGALFLGVDFSNADLSNANLSGGHFCDCNFKRANLCGTNFQESNVDGCKY
jgi:uncharacterized protein YjbI with pentapeptide repeats